MIIVDVHDDDVVVDIIAVHHHHRRPLPSHCLTKGHPNKVKCPLNDIAPAKKLAMQAQVRARH